MKSDITVVFEGKFIDANYLKSILEENGISSLIKNNLTGQLYPMYVAYGWIKQVKVFVEKKNEKKAKEIVSIYFDQ
jgi:hypothetical protein